MSVHQIKLLSQSMLGELNSDLVLQDGKTIGAGEKVIIFPETIAECVLLPNGKSLAEGWGTDGRPADVVYRDIELNVAELCREMLRYANRLAKVESENELIKGKLGLI